MTCCLAMNDTHDQNGKENQSNKVMQEQQKKFLSKKAAPVDELPMEEHPFFLDAAEEDDEKDPFGEEAEEVIQEIAQELDGQILPEVPDEAVHVDDFVIPMPCERPQASGAKQDSFFSFEEDAEEEAEEEEIFAVLESEPEEEGR